MTTFTGLPGSSAAAPSYFTAAYSGPLSESFGFELCAISSTEVLVRFDVVPNLEDPKSLPTASAVSALNKAHYALSASVGVPTPPQITGVRISGTEPNSVVLSLAHPLKYNANYSISATSVRSADGTRGVISEARNFQAKTEDPPLVCGVYFGSYETISIVYDRNISVAGSVTVDGSSSTTVTISSQSNVVTASITGFSLSSPVAVVISGVTDIYGNTLSSYTTSVTYHPDFDITNFGTLKCLDAYVAQYVKTTGGYTIVARLILSLPINAPSDSDFTISSGPAFVLRNGIKKIESGFCSTSVAANGACSYFLDLYLDGSNSAYAVNGFVINSASLTATGDGSPTTLTNITVRPLTDPAEEQNTYLSPQTAFAGSTDRTVTSESTDVSITTAQPLVRSTSLYTDLPHTYFAVCDLWYSYASHLSQTHKANDSFAITGPDLPAAPTFAAIKSSLSSFVQKFVTHTVSAYHGFDDPNLGSLNVLSGIDASTNVEELSPWLAKVIEYLDSHSQNAGLHTLNGVSESFKWSSCVYNNTVNIAVKDMLIGGSYQISSDIASSYFNGSTQALGFNESPISFSVIGNAKTPQVSAAYMISGVEDLYGDPRLWKDRVVVWFSKPMQQILLSALNIGVTTDAKSWLADRYVKCDVSGTSAGTQSLTAANMLDLASNGVP